MGNFFKYERISTSEDREIQKFTRQDKALDRYAAENGIEYLAEFRDDASGGSFERKEWKRLEKALNNGDTIIFKELSRFTRECDNGYKKYMELIENGIELIFIDNPTVSTPYIKQMMKIAEGNQNRIARKSLEQTIELLLMVELDRVQTERETIVKRINDGIAASDKTSGRKKGKLDKMTDALKEDIKAYVERKNIDAIGINVSPNREIRQNDLIQKHKIARNTLKKYIEIIKADNGI